MDYKPAKIYDAHLHYGLPKLIKKVVETSSLREKYPAYRSVQLNGMEDYPRLLKTHGVQKTVLIPFVFKELNAVEEDQRVMELASAHRDSLFPYILLDEDNPEFYIKHGKECLGLKEHIILNKTELTDKRRELLSLLNENNGIFLIHTETSSRIDYVSSIIQDFPHLKIQIAHMGRGKRGDTSFIKNVMEAFQKDENVFFDTSTIRDPLMIKLAVSIIGSERLLYGSDFPFYMDNNGEEDIMLEQIKHVVNSGLPVYIQEKIFFENFNKLILTR